MRKKMRRIIPSLMPILIPSCPTRALETVPAAPACRTQAVCTKTGTANASQIDKFTNWGSSPAVTEPQNAIPFSSAFAS
jgi:hypothetical protein